MQRQETIDKVIIVCIEGLSLSAKSYSYSKLKICMMAMMMSMTNFVMYSINRHILPALIEK